MLQSNNKNYILKGWENLPMQKIEISTEEREILQKYDEVFYRAIMSMNKSLQAPLLTLRSFQMELGIIVRQFSNTNGTDICLWMRAVIEQENINEVEAYCPRLAHVLKNVLFYVRDEIFKKEELYVSIDARLHHFENQMSYRNEAFFVYVDGAFGSFYYNAIYSLYALENQKTQQGNVLDEELLRKLSYASGRAYGIYYFLNLLNEFKADNRCIFSDELRMRSKLGPAKDIYKEEYKDAFTLALTILADISLKQLDKAYEYKAEFAILKPFQNILYPLDYLPPYYHKLKESKYDVFAITPYEYNVILSLKHKFITFTSKLT